MGHSYPSRAPPRRAPPQAPAATAARMWTRVVHLRGGAILRCGPGWFISGATWGAEVDRGGTDRRRRGVRRWTGVVHIGVDVGCGGGPGWHTSGVSGAAAEPDGRQRRDHDVGVRRLAR